MTGFQVEAVAESSNVKLPDQPLSRQTWQISKKNLAYSRKFHAGVFVSPQDLRHFVMPRISLCISEDVCPRQSGTVPGSSRAELPYELPLTSSLQIIPENVRHCKNGRIAQWPNAACLEFLAAACVPSFFYERGLALFLVFPYLAKKTPLGQPIRPSDLSVRFFARKIFSRSGKHPICCIFPFGH